MLCRTTTLVHRGSGVAVTTPLLVPSFSSKGFSRSSRIRGPDRDGFRTLLHQTVASTSEFLDRYYLISAFDVFYGHLPPATEITRSPELIFLDSGGYEIADYQDLSEIEEIPGSDKPWASSHLLQVLDSWPDELPAVFVSFDHPNIRKPFKEQVADARALFRGREKHLKTFLLKPETTKQETLQDALNAAIANVSELSTFDIVGVTEWEIGSSILDRMENIARLRIAMDSKRLSHIPLHVFGALDPLSTVLYFLSGAEIFDGLTWLRYAYDDARCVYRHNHAALSYPLNTPIKKGRSLMLAQNYYYLQQLELDLRDFVSTREFSKLQPFDTIFRPLQSTLGTFLKDASDTLNTKLNRRAE